MPRRLIIGTLLFALVASPAYARRHPRAHERRAIASHMGVPPRCARIWISTVNRRWASFRSSTRRTCVMWAGDGVVVLHRRNGRWHQAVAGSDIPCPVPNVPARIVRDLRVYCDDSR
jgi:hypothetical protein